MKYPNPKPGTYQYPDNNSSVMIDAALFFSKNYRSNRPKEVDPLAKPIPLPSKDVYHYNFETEALRNNVNKSKNIPHKDYVPLYTPPYYSIYETGWR